MESIVAVRVRYSKRAELERVLRCLKIADWYRENGYRIVLPKGLVVGKTYRRDRVERAVEKEYREKDYDAAAKVIETAWKRVSGRFVRALMRDGIPFLNEYTVQLTKYGTRGSYNPPKGIVINIDREDMDIGRTLRHEIIHLIIHKDIQRYKISHWKKERLVDLICRKIVGRGYRMQTIAEVDPRVDACFNEYYPDLSRVIRAMKPSL